MIYYLMELLTKLRRKREKRIKEIGNTNGINH